MRTLLTIMIALAVALTSLVAASSPRAASAAPASDQHTPLGLYRNGHLVAEPVLSAYLALGGAERLGEPLTDYLTAPGGSGVQFFTFARVEVSPSGQVSLSHLGRQAAVGHPDADAFRWRAAEEIGADRHYVAESGHSVGGALAWWWETSGGVARHGYPISEEIGGVDAAGLPTATQFFERSVAIYHFTNGAITVEPLGERAAAIEAPDHRAATPPPALLGRGEIRYRAGSPAGTNIERGVASLNGRTVAHGGRLSFLASVGPITAERGYVGGPAIENGQLVNDSIGGGICSVSTILYRAAWSAGLPIVERHNHTYWLNAYADRPGLEAAIYEPGLDLQIANDTGAPITLVARTEGGVAVVEIWGRTTGRTVSLRPAQIVTSESTAQARTWASTAETAQRAGARVINERVISEGGRSRTERAITVYRPLPTSQRDPEPTPAPREDEPTSEGRK